MKDQRARRRFTRTGRPQNREVLRQHRVDVKRAANIVSRIDGADLDVRIVGGGEDGAHVLGRDRQHLAARDRVTGDAAAEIGQASGRSGLAFAEEVDLANDLAVIAGLQGTDIGDQPGRTDQHLDLAADLPGHGDRRIGVAGQHLKSLEIHPDLGARTGDLQHPANRRH